MSNRNWIRKKRRLVKFINHGPVRERLRMFWDCNTFNQAVEKLAKVEADYQAANPPLPVKAQSYEARCIDVATLGGIAPIIGPLLMKAAHRRKDRD